MAKKCSLNPSRVAAGRWLRVLCLGWPLGSLAQPTSPLPADTARAVRLPEATVTGYGQQLPLRRTAAAVGVLETQTLKRFGPASIAQAVNTLPGVRLEERATASYRLSVRGSTLRSPFGVRNVKVYYFDIPYTDASGSTALNLLDPAQLGRLEVIKGPAGSVYGAGTGGVVRLENRRPAAEGVRVQAGGLVGSYGLRRYDATAETSSATGYLRTQYAHQTLTGYRQQSALRRDAVALDGEWKAPVGNRTLALHALYTDLYYELPGGLTRAQFAENPRQARPGTASAPGTVAQQASYATRAALLGATYEQGFGEKLTSKTTLYLSGSTVETPYLIDFQRIANLGWGLRSAWSYRAIVAGRVLRLTAGGELQNGFANDRSYQNRGGTPGPLRYDDELRTRTGFGFAQADYDLPAGLLLTAVASYNGLRYRVARVSDAAVNPAGYRFGRGFRPQALPRLALLKELGPHAAAYASLSTGYSPPTDAELRPSDGSYNETLQAERGTSYELGTRGTLLAGRLTFDVAAYEFRLRNTIVTRTTDLGTSLFLNAGDTRQLGLEVALSGWLWQPATPAGAGAPGAAVPAAPLPGLRAWLSYAYNHYRFGHYESNGQDYSGNQLTGTAPHTLAAGLEATAPLGFYLRPNLSHQARLPLNDANTEYAAGYWVFGARAGWQRTVWSRLEAEIYVGLDNAADRRYSLGNDLNAFGGRYFQPAPGRSFYAGAQAGWRW